MLDSLYEYLLMFFIHASAVGFAWRHYQTYLQEEVKPVWRLRFMRWTGIINTLACVAIVLHALNWYRGL